MSQRPPDDEAPLVFEIDLVLQMLAASPDDAALHQRLRATALRYKAQGGQPPGVFERLKHSSHDPIERLLHAERIWSLDAGNRSLIPTVLAALAALERSQPERDFAAVRRWLYSVLSEETP